MQNKSRPRGPKTRPCGTKSRRRGPKTHPCGA
ncbi:MAG: hypothetical protein BJ554DRAFT_3830, partial [Olpidium bornovanus]